MFRAIAAPNFPPFGSLEIEFPPVKDRSSELAEVHLFTGVNGTGKTRILALLAAFLGGPEALTARIRSQTTDLQFRATRVSFTKSGAQRDWGQIAWSKEGDTFEVRPGNNSEWFRGIPAFAYGGAAYVSDHPVAVMAELQKPNRTSCLAFNRVPGSSRELLQAVVNLRLQAAMESMTLNDHAAHESTGRCTRIIQVLQETLCNLTGQPFEFRVQSYPKLSLEVRWGARLLSFNALPDGLRSIIGWLVHAVVMLDVWLDGKGDPFQTEAVFLLDEVESHLHPAWQRRILPAWQRLFPKSQIFVATHSPFVIASLNHGWIHCLKPSESGTVLVEEPRSASEGDSYIFVLEEIMGIKEWYDPETEQLLSEFRLRRNEALAGDATAAQEARKLAVALSRRSLELEFMMGKELNQMDRRLQMRQGEHEKV